MSTDAPPGHSCTVLVVDADEDVVELLRLALSSDGYDVAAAGDGREALMQLRSRAETCAIVLELRMPVMDGTRFREAQLRDRSLAWIPVVVMSAEIDASTKARALGARAFLPKPLDLDQVRATLRGIGCLRTRRQPLRTG